MLRHSPCLTKLTMLLLAGVQEFYQIYQADMNKGLTYMWIVYMHMLYQASKINYHLVGAELAIAFYYS